MGLIMVKAGIGQIAKKASQQNNADGSTSTQMPFQRGGKNINTDNVGENMSKITM